LTSGGAEAASPVSRHLIQQDIGTEKSTGFFPVYRFFAIAVLDCPVLDCHLPTMDKGIEMNREILYNRRTAGVL
jgi:hypothetical protein